MVGAPVSPAAAQTAGPSRDDVQVVYLFNFAKFVRWPEGSGQGPLTICVAGQKGYVESLGRLVKGEQVDGRPLGVKGVHGAGDVGGCDIVFLGDGAKDQIDAVVAATAGKPVLTVSDQEGFLERGGMIQFVVIGNRVRFSVDLGPAQRSGIGLSSELLKVAVAVKGAAGGGR